MKGIFLLMVIAAVTGQGPSGGGQDNPGARFCLRPKGLDAVAVSLGKVVDTEISKFVLINANIPLAFDQNGLLAVKRVRITKYTPSGSHTMRALAPNLLQWISKDFSFISQGLFSTSLFGIGSGSFVAQSTNAAVEVRVTVDPATGRNDQKPYLTVANCTATAKNSQLDVSQDGLLGTILSLYKDQIQKQKVRVVEELICQTVSYYLQNVMNEMINLSRFNGSMLDTSPDYPKLTSDLVYNYGLMKPGTVSANSFQLDSYGETSWRNLGGTPFNPAFLDTTLSTDNMMDMYISDYSMNSMFYHAYSHRLLDATFGDQKSLNFKPALQVSCSAKSQCLGSIYPDISKRYQAQSAQMVMTLDSAPYVIFAKGQNPFYLNATLNFVAKPKTGKIPAEMFLSVSSRWEGGLNFDFNKINELTSILSIKKFELKSISQNFTADQMKSLSNLIRPILEKEINKKLSKGYSISDNPIGDLIKPLIQYADRTMIVSTGFSIDDKYLLKLAAQARIYGESS